MIHDGNATPDSEELLSLLFAEQSSASQRVSSSYKVWYSLNKKQKQTVSNRHSEENICPSLQDSESVEEQQGF